MYDSISEAHAPETRISLNVLKRECPPLSSFSKFGLHVTNSSTANKYTHVKQLIADVQTMQGLEFLGENLDSLLGSRVAMT